MVGVADGVRELLPAPLAFGVAAVFELGALRSWALTTVPSFRV